MTDTGVAAAPLSDRRVLGIAVPIVLSNATVPILGAVDTAVVGQMGAAAPIGAVGIGAIILSSIYWVFGFLRMGTTGLAAQARGAGDVAETDALLLRALLIAAVGGVGLIVLQGPLFAGAFRVAPASDEVEGLARSYLTIRIWSAPAAIAVFAITGWLIAAERTGAVLVIQVWMNGLNIGLDLLFVLGFGWGVEGVAVATVIAEVAGAGLGLWFCRGVLGRPHWRDAPRVFDRARLVRMAMVNRDILIRSLLLQAIFVSFLFLGADLGDVPLAANQVLLQFLHVTSYAMDGFAFAAEALVGKATGAKARGAIRRAALVTGRWGFGICALMAAAFAMGGGALVDVMTTAPEVRLAARDYLPWMVAAPLLGALGWMLDGVFIGATRTADMRNMMIVSAIVYAGAVAAFVPVWANHGLWAALMVSYIVRGLTLLWRYPALERAVGRAET